MDDYGVCKYKAFEESRNKLLDDYKFIEKLRAERRKLQARVDELATEIEIASYKYRNKSVGRVLDYLRFNADNKHEYETFMVHCMNKLNGNIDGVEISFKKKEAPKDE